MKKVLIVAMLLLTAFGYSQSQTISGLKLKKVQNAMAMDTILAIGTDGRVLKTAVPVSVLGVTSSFTDVVSGLPNTTPTTSAYRTGKVGLNETSPQELLDIIGTQAGSTGAVKSDYTWSTGEISRVALGGQNILSELGVPAGVTKGNLLDYFGAGARAGYRAYIVNGNFGAVNAMLGDFAFSAGVTNLAGTNFANINAYPQGAGFDIVTRVQNASADIASVNVRQFGLGSPNNLETTIHNVVQNSEGNTASIRITPHYVETTNLQKLPSYGDGTFIESYVHTDNVAKTGTAETTIGAPTYGLAVDATGTVMEVPIGSGGDVSKVGTPIDNQVAVWTGDGTLEGSIGFRYDGWELFLGDGATDAEGTGIGPAYMYLYGDANGGIDMQHYFDGWRFTVGNTSNQLATLIKETGIRIQDDISQALEINTEQIWFRSTDGTGGVILKPVDRLQGNTQPTLELPSEDGIVATRAWVNTSAFEGITETGTFEDFNYHLVLGNPDAVNLVVSDSLYNISTTSDFTVDGGQLRTTEGKIYIGAGGSQGVLNMQNNTANRTYTFPDWSGRVVLNRRSGLLSDANYTLTSADNMRKVFELPASVPRTFTIPQGSTISNAFGGGEEFKLVNTGSANITITTTGLASILGGDYMLLPNKGVTIYPSFTDGDTWIVED